MAFGKSGPQKMLGEKKIIKLKYIFINCPCIGRQSGYSMLGYKLFNIQTLEHTNA